MTTPGTPVDEYERLVARVREAQAAREHAEQEWHAATAALRAYVRRADLELSDDQRRVAEGLLADVTEHRRAWHPPPS